MAHVRVVAGISQGVCGGAASGFAEDAMAGLSLPAECGVRPLLTPVRSAGQDTVGAGCAAIGGVCICDLSVPRGHSTWYIIRPMPWRVCMA